MPEYQNDHDLLIELKTIVQSIQRDLTDMKDTTKARVDDHETRIRANEFKIYLFTGALTILSFITPYLWSLFNK